MHEMHEMPNNREFSSMNDESKDEAGRTRFFLIFFSHLFTKSSFFLDLESIFFENDSN